MSKLVTVKDLLVQEIKDLFSAENQLTHALPKMAEGASDPELKKGFENHLKETEVQMERLEKVAELLDASPRGKACEAMKGLVKEGEEALKEDADPDLKDLALIIAAQKVEHYEIAGYGGARALAEAMQMNKVVELLQATLDEEGKTDQKLTEIASRILARTKKSAD